MPESTPPPDDTWVFGYGSLMWDGWEKDFDCTTRMVASLPGYRRTFNKPSIRNWGTRLAPCPTLNVEQHPQAVCVGMAFLFPPEKRDAVVGYLRKREGNGFEIAQRPVQLPDGTKVQAFAPLYSGKDTLDAASVNERACMVRVARGTSGPGIDYVRGIAGQLKTLGIDDPAVRDLWAALVVENQGDRMRIARLAKAQGYRIFRDFSWPATGLHDFSRYNVIYGWNGAGKTSLSTIFRHLQRKQPLSEGQVQVVVDQAIVNGADFGTAPLPALRVFNRDTVDRSVFESAGQQLPPVFFFGEDSVEKQRQIEQLTIQLNTALEQAVKHRRDEATASAAFESFCSEEAKGIKNLLTVAGGGPYNNYNAANFKVDVASLAQANFEPAKLSEADRKKHLDARNAAIMDTVEEPSVGFPDLVDLTNKTRAALERSVVSKVVDRLAANPSLATWVGSGLTLHTGENATDTCEFCGGPLQPERVQQLEDHFNDEFKRFQCWRRPKTEPLLRAVPI